ncbi:MAG: hypothetical protein U9R16_10015 [Campylobacterota bacterium]|nr:hypothetical protein [Campylobacterota bacterium]
MDIQFRFNKLFLYQKVEIYLLVIMLYGVGLYYISNISITKKSFSEIPIEDLKYKKKIQNLKSKIVKKPNSYMVKLLEQKSEKFGCFISSIEINKNNFNLSISGKYIDIINFLNYLQNHFIINRFELNIDKKIFILSIDLATNYFYNLNKIYTKLENISNPFINFKKDTKKRENRGIKLFAVISSNVLINNVWYKLNEIVDNKKIISIGLNSVELLDIKSGEKISLKVYSEKI